MDDGNATQSRTGQSTSLDVFNAIKIVHAFAIVLFNSIIVVALVKFRWLVRVRDYFALSLAVADLFVGLQSIYNSILYYAGAIDYANIVFGASSHATFKFSVYASVLTFVAFSLIQCWAITHPLQPNVSVQQCLTAIATVWLVSSVFVILGTTLKFTNSPSYRYYKEAELSAYIIACLLIITTYALILWLIKRRKRRIQTGTMFKTRASSASATSEHAHITVSHSVSSLSSRRPVTSKALAITLTITALFIACFAPYVAFEAIKLHRNGKGLSKLVELYITHIVLPTRSLIDPILQSFNYRDALMGRWRFR